MSLDKQVPLWEGEREGDAAAGESPQIKAVSRAALEQILTSLEVDITEAFHDAWESAVTATRLYEASGGAPKSPAAFSDGTFIPTPDWEK